MLKEKGWQKGKRVAERKKDDRKEKKQRAADGNLFLSCCCWDGNRGSNFFWVGAAHALK